MSNAPGPGIYALPSLLTTQKDFNKSGTSGNFHKPIAVPIENDPKHEKPAPNAYNVSYDFVKYAQITFALLLPFN
jgi:hypothetical protein